VYTIQDKQSGELLGVTNWVPADSGDYTSIIRRIQSTPALLATLAKSGITKTLQAAVQSESRERARDKYFGKKKTFILFGVYIKPKYQRQGLGNNEK
jgi:hypothetical protein